MIVVNLFGGPGCGKSTTAAWLFNQLKERGVNCEYVTEFAKDLTWETNLKALSCQEYVFGNQSWRLARLQGKVDVVITDSPLPLAIIYDKGRLGEDFAKIAWKVYNEYDNINFYLLSPEQYDSVGRNQTKEEANQIGETILDMLIASGEVGSVVCCDVFLYPKESKSAMLQTILDQIN